MAEKRYFDLVFDIPLRTSFTYAVDAKGEAAVGKRAMASFGRRELLGYIIAEKAEPGTAIAESAIKPIRRIVDAAPLFADEQVELARWMAGYYLCGIGEALSAMIPSGRREIAPAPFLEEELELNASALKLSIEQQNALDAILNGKESLYYLYGITGSGKTEVFLRAAERFLSEGKSVIYLVPEIALTHQVVESVAARFGDLATTLHSGMTGSERLNEWNRISEGKARIVVGPRSAVFAPVKDLALIVLDEEHDGSYKSGNSPRYHARQVAMRRIARTGGRLVMGSATPSVEAWASMADKTIVRLDLTERLSGGAPPSIRAVDLRNSDGVLSRELCDEIRASHQAGRQSILFLNRRGFSYFYHCNHCGYELKCRQCSVSLTYHKSQGRAVCHYCGYSEPIPRSCPQCSSLEAGFKGFGTELIEEEVARTFPELRIQRVDADSSSQKGSLKEALDNFRSGKIDLLLGTQMVAKGLNFPGVRLVGVVLADTGLQLPDFRAAERTFSLILQVAGRAGRYFPDGRVLVQSYRTESSTIQQACALDIEGFYRLELEQRRITGFPPFTRIIRFVARSKEAHRAERALDRLAGLLTPNLPAAADILGPAECPLSVIAGNARRQLIVRAPEMKQIHSIAHRAMETYEQDKEPGVYIEIDVDPMSLL